jgi:hypothetical protein
MIETEKPCSWPFVSIIIVNFNGEAFLKNCLQSLLSTDYPAFEVIVVDNGSSDRSIQLIQQYVDTDTRVKLLRNRRNLGFARACNMGLSLARGEYVVLLNNDTEVSEGWLKALVEAVSGDSTVGAAQPKVLLINDRSTLDSCGDYMTSLGLLYHLGYLQKDTGELSKQTEIFAAKGAAMVVRKSLLYEIGWFDPDFFFYYEELDLCWRVWLRGYKVIFVPKSLVYHALGGTARRAGFLDMLILYHGPKNYITTLIKNLSFPYLVRFMIPYLLFSLFYALYKTLGGSKLAISYIIRAWAWNILNLRRTWEKRLIVQKRVRRVPDRAIFRRLKIRKPHPPSFYLSFVPRKLRSIGIT